ncbi:hypothetical protein [Microbacterium sp. AG1240]|uniref:hypothetical protein n=1 Tax=Microbacterium sp. AG1240 TaxID=2183992 RepID=UPI000EAFC69A|nr:hypothetical protein [Microbacterium sp. AG1240]
MDPIDLRHLPDDGGAAISELVATTPERPLYVRVGADDAASVSLLSKLGFVEVSRTASAAAGHGRTAEEIVLALPPTLE